MRTRLVAAMTAAALAVSFLFSATADAWPSDEKCDHPVSAEHKCEGGKR